MTIRRHVKSIQRFLNESQRQSGLYMMNMVDLRDAYYLLKKRYPYHSISNLALSGIKYQVWERDD